MNESIIEAEHFRRYFCMFDIVLVQIHSNTPSISLSLIIYSSFESGEIGVKRCQIFHHGFLSFCTQNVKNLKHFNSVSRYIGLSLIADSMYLNGFIQQYLGFL